MKNTGKAKSVQKARRTAFAALIALSFTLGFAALSLAGCDNGTTSGGNNPNYLGQTFTLTDVPVEDPKKVMVPGKKYEFFRTYTDLATFTKSWDYEVTVQDGILNMRLGTPSADLPMWFEFEHRSTKDLIVSPPTLKCYKAWFMYSETPTDIHYSDTSRNMWYFTPRGNAFVNSIGIMYESVDFWYADRDGRVTGGAIDSSMVYIYDLTLKRGWNRVVLTYIPPEETGNNNWTERVETKEPRSTNKWYFY